MPISNHNAKAKASKKRRKKREKLKEKQKRMERRRLSEETRMIVRLDFHDDASLTLEGLVHLLGKQGIRT